MDSDSISSRHERLMQILGDALDLPAGQRDGFVASACGEDAELRGEVLRLLSRESMAAQSIPSVHDAVESMSAQTAPPPDAMIGQSVGAFEFINVIGQGGMGIVYLGRDTRLRRDVAIKAISPGFSGDASRLARFEREARVIASLSHPNIATVYGLEETPNARFLVMELLGGQTLSQRLRENGAMSIPDALHIAAQIAAGLEAAHEAGIVHRDLKPGNIMFASDDTLKILDFGLASDVARRRTASGRLADTDLNITRQGSVMGTPSYMSPEQLRGEQVDRRTDVFAFGCVLFECLTGIGAFPGDSSAQIVAAVLEREPDWNHLPARTPTGIRKLLRRCLAKDPQQRLRDLGDAKLDLLDATAEREWQNDHKPENATRRKPAALLTVAVLAAAAIILGLMMLRGNGPSAASSGATQYFAIPFPNAQPQLDVAKIRVAISRDGSQLVVSASDGADHRLWLRSRGEMALKSLEGTEGGRAPSLSPDGQWLVYFSDGAMMKRRTAGGVPYRIYSLFGWWGSAYWGTDDVVTFLPSWGKGMARISAEGGVPKFVSQLRNELKEFAHLSPCILNDNRTALVTIWDGKSGLRIASIDMENGQRRSVVENAWTPRVAATPHGDYLLWCRANTIFAAPFDQARAAVTGPETAIVDGVMTDRVLFSACYDVADDGTLVYLPGGTFIEQSRLSWLNADGKTTTAFNDDRLGFGDARFSSDGSRLLVLVKGDEYKPYLYDLKRGTFTAIVADSDVEAATISRDGQWLAYTSNRNGRYSLWIKNLVDGREQMYYTSDEDYQASPDFSPDGKYVIFTTPPADSPLHDVLLLDVEAKKVSPLCVSAGEERNPRFAPSGKWVAYVSDISGTREIYLKSFPDGQTVRQITFGGADWPDWAPDGRTIYFRKQGSLYSVPVSPEDGSTTARPSLMYGGRFGQADYHMSDYAISPDGRIMLVEPSERGPIASHLNVVLNWHEIVGKKKTPS